MLRSVVYSLSSASLSFTAVALTCASSGFPVSLLAGYVLLPHSTEVVFLVFFMISLWFRFLLLADLSVVTFGSPVVGSFLWSLFEFRLCVLFFISR